MLEDITKEITLEEMTEIQATEEESSVWDGATTVSVYEADNYTVTFMLNSEWGTGYNASIKIENTGDTVIHDWYLEYEATHTITNIWNAVVYESTDSTCVIKNAEWNQDILVGGFVEFGFSGEGAFSEFPKSYKILGDKAEVDDYIVSYQLNSDWGSGFSGTISITNNTDTTLEDWILEFDFAREITSIWNATIESYEDYHYVIRNAGYNENIVSGQTISFGFNGQSGKVDDAPINYLLLQYTISDVDIKDIFFELDVVEMDYQESENGGFYFLSNEKSTLSGIAKNISMVDEFNYTIEDKNSILCSGKIDKEDNWMVNNIGFGPGYNLLTISAIKGDQYIEKEYIIINMNLSNVSNLGIDIYIWIVI